MNRKPNNIKEFLFNLLFPKSCLNCGQEGEYLCEDCLALIDIFDRQFCPFCSKVVPDGKTCKTCRKSKNLTGLYAASPYQNPISQRMIKSFKHQPFLKELKKPLANLILAHLQMLEKEIECFKQFLLIPVPLTKKELRWRGFNQSEEIAKELSSALKIPLISSCLIKTKETSLQVEPAAEIVKKNIKDVFRVKNNEETKGKKVLLVDDVFTTGATLEKCAKVLKKAGAKEVWGIVAARK